MLTEEFQTSDPWEDFIINYIEHRDYIRLSDVLTHLQVDLSRQERSHQMPCWVILKKMGWEREFRMIGNKRVRVWAKLELERPSDELADRPDRPFSEIFQFTGEMGLKPRPSRTAFSLS